MPGDGHLCGPSGRLAAISSNLEFIPSVKGTGKRAKTFQGRLKKGGRDFFFPFIFAICHAPSLAIFMYYFLSSV